MTKEVIKGKGVNTPKRTADNRRLLLDCYRIHAGHILEVMALKTDTQKLRLTEINTLEVTGVTSRRFLQ